MLEEDRVRVCGPKHARAPGRDVVRGGTIDGEVVLGGRRVSVRRSRARRVDGGEVRLPTYETPRAEDPLHERAVEQMLVGVATRKYARSIEPLPASVATRGTSKSAVSRRFVARTRAELDAWTRRPLGELNIVALMVDGIGFGEHTLVVALGIDATGQKHALAIREGSTENATLCRSLLADLVARGVPADRSILVVIDGGTGLRSAVKSVFGEYALVQRCQVHKKRNVLDHLPEHAKPHARAALQRAYALDDADKAKDKLERLARSLDEQHPSAAASLREGLDETLTVMRLGVGATLRKSLATTNPIESTFSTVRRVSRRVTRWQSGTMALRCVLAGTMEAEKTWRRLMGKADMPKLVTALRRLDLARAAPLSATARRAA
ncbi:MAG TPA: IS256 family transposase [Kofleriaceae bacterium]|jgi:transposase-like protein